jgi:hypothetical protein
MDKPTTSASRQAPQRVKLQKKQNFTSMSGHTKSSPTVDGTAIAKWKLQPKKSYKKDLKQQDKKNWISCLKTE